MTILKEGDAIEMVEKYKRRESGKGYLPILK